MTKDSDRHNIIVERDLWKAAKDKAAKEDMSISQVVRKLLRKWLGK